MMVNGSGWKKNKKGAKLMKDKLKILHIWNTAGVPQTLAKFQRKLGHKADVITRTISDVTRNLADPDIVKSVIGGPKKYTLTILMRAWKYDIIHSHAPRFYNKYIRRFHPRKIWVAHFHGTDIRGRWKENASHHRGCDFLAVSTPELLIGCESNVQWIPNPVDTDHFNRTQPYKPKTALFVFRWERQRPALEQAIKECKQFGVELTIRDRATEFIPHKDFPAYLQQFEYYMDTKTYETFDPVLKDTKWDIPNSEVKMNDSLSLTALQQLGMGGKVINNYQVTKTFPDEYEPDLVAENWIDIYRRLLK